MGGFSARDFSRAALRFRGPQGLPRLWFFTDPQRTPSPCTIAARLPPDTAVVYRHFGDPERRTVARRLQRACRARGLRFLIGADWSMADSLGAEGVHLPERLSRSAAALKQARPDWIVTIAAHSIEGLRSTADAAILSPIYPSRSPSAGVPIGLRHAARMISRAASPVIALGGVRLEHFNDLARAGFSGAAGIDLFSE